MPNTIASNQRHWRTGKSSNSIKWFLPEKRKDLVRNYTKVIQSTEYPLSVRRQVFYSLIRPTLEWLIETLISYGLEKDEAESEVFLLCARVMKNFEPERSSFLVYTERAIPWYTAALIKKIGRETLEEGQRPTEAPERSYEMPNEIYLTCPKFLFETRFLGKDLSYSEKTLILSIITEDDYDCRSLGEKNSTSKSTMNSRLKDLKRLIKERMTQDGSKREIHTA